MHRRMGRRLLMQVWALLGVLVAFGACTDNTSPTPPSDERGVVLNSLEVSLTIFSVEDPTQTITVGLAPEGSPVSLAVSRDLAVVPLGYVPAVAVVDLAEGQVVRTVALPQGSGATGVAFLTPTTALVANPSRNTVSPVDVGAGTVAAEIPVGSYPQAIVTAGTRVAVLNAELGEDFQPTGPGTVSVLDRGSLEVLGTVPLSGENPGSAVVGPDGLLYVLDSGRFGAGDGSLSVVDLSQMREVDRYQGFGEFPYSQAFAPAGDVLYVASFGYGLAVWDADMKGFLRRPEEAVTPEGIPSVAGLGFDGEGRLYTLRPDCSEPSVINRLGASFEIDLTIPVGLCPIALAFTGAPG